MADACLIKEVGGNGEIFKRDPCKLIHDGYRGEERHREPCDLGPVSVKVKGKDAEAYFCRKQYKVWCYGIPAT